MNLSNNRKIIFWFLVFLIIFARSLDRNLFLPHLYFFFKKLLSVRWILIGTLHIVWDLSPAQAVRSVASLLTRSFSSSLYSFRLCIRCTITNRSSKYELK